jgi:uncharacterized protein
VRLENGFRVAAPIDEAWRLLNDVPSVVPCMPGVELKEAVGENAWKATMQVKLGPIALRFLIDVTRDEADEAARRVVLSANAREARGRGGAQARIESKLSEDAGETAVAIVTDLTLQGAVAQYGRGIVGDVAAQLTKQFADCLAARLAQEPGAALPAPVAKPVAGLPLLWRALLGLFRRVTRPN